MLGFRTGKENHEQSDRDQNADVAKLFFDTFSGRVGRVEEGFQSISRELERLKLSSERSQISDLVLLERLQKTEALMRESLYSIRTTLDKMIEAKESVGPKQKLEPDRPTPMESDGQTIVSEARMASHILSPTGELGSLPSITTPTELQVLTLLAREGPKSAPEIGRVVGRSREHTARLMKRLYEDGYIRRDQTRIPFRYSVVDRVKKTVVKSEPKGEEQETVSAPQS